MADNWAELRRLEKAATFGTWEVRHGGNFTDFGAAGFTAYCDENGDSATDLKVGSTNVRFGNRLLKRSRADANLIIALRNAAPRLLDCAEREPRLLAIEKAAKDAVKVMDEWREQGLSDLSIEGIADALRDALEGK